MATRLAQDVAPRLLSSCAWRCKYPPRAAHLPVAFTARAMSSHLPSVKPPLSTILPSDSYQLLPTSTKAGSAEDALFDQQVEDVRQWWASSRYEGIKRPYSAEDVVSKRGSTQQTYLSSLMARKLFNLLKERATAGEPVHTSESQASRALMQLKN